nr:39S ribosomal protein L37, mitochondrial-like isoform X2 [Cherax quadricarinatus]
MRVTDVRLRLNIGAQFRALWLLKSRRRISDTGAEAILTARGVPVVDPREILSPAYPRIIEVVDPPPQPSVLQDWKTEVKDTPCHVFNKRFSPLIGMPQVQCLTNSVVQSSLPKSVLDCATKITEEEDKKVKDKTLTYQLLLLLDQQVPGALERQLVEDTLTQVTLKHSDSLMQINHEAAFIVSSLTPLPQLADNAEIKSLQEETLPDIYPLSPLVNCRAFNTYCLKDSYDCW